MIPVFLYNVLLIILYTTVLYASLSNYLERKNRLFLFLFLLFLFFILDHVMIYMTEFIASFAIGYNQMFLTSASIKTIICVAIASCSFLIVSFLIEKKLKRLPLVLLILFSVWLLIVPFFSNSSLKVWLYYLPNQLVKIYLGLMIYFILKKKEFSATRSYYLTKTLYVYLIGGFLILLEDSYVIFYRDDYSSTLLKMNNRNVCEDFFTVALSFLCLRYFLKGDESEVSIVEELSEKNPEEVVFEKFCYVHKFTQRESEIFRQLLEHKHNQEIADEMYLSLGTVKTHIHNIFVKLDVTSRNEIFYLYEQYLEER